MIKDKEIIKRRDPEPTISRLEVLVESIKEGKIKLPNFQRPFVWQKNDILNLLDSIYRGYPIGSILLWSTTEKLSSERSILESLDLSSEDSSFQSEYLLDGQQRLTSVCGVLYWDGLKKTNKWNVYFDLENEEFVYSENNDLVTLFPLNKLLETRSFLKECMKFEHHTNANLFYSRAENLLKAIKDYKIAVVKIGDMKLEEVAPVFERINSRGRVLTMLDLMRAATWKGGFDLTQKIEEIIKAVRDAGFGNLESDVVLKCISSAAGKGFNKADIDKLRTLKSNELFTAAKEAKDALLKAFNFLKNIANINDESFVPYSQQIVLLCEFFRIHEDEITVEYIRQLRSWFWSTSISKHFSGASTGDNSRELLRMREFASGKNIDLHPIKKINIAELLYDDFNLRVASSSTMAALLNSVVHTIDLNGNSIDPKELNKNKDFFKPIISNSDSKCNLMMVLCRGKKELNINNIINKDDVELEKNFLNSSILLSISLGQEKLAMRERAQLFLSFISKLVEIEVVLEE